MSSLKCPWHPDVYSIDAALALSLVVTQPANVAIQKRQQLTRQGALLAPSRLCPPPVLLPRNATTYLWSFCRTKQPELKHASKDCSTLEHSLKLKKKKV